MREAFLAYLRDVRRYSSRTLSLYGEALRDFSRWSGAEEDVDGGGLPAQLIPSRIREYTAHLMDERRLDPATVRLHLSALSGFCRFLVRKGALRDNPVQGVRRPKKGKRLPEYFTRQAMEAYFSGEVGPAYGQRLRHLVVSLLFCTGIRRAELLALRRGDVDWGRRTLRVHGKGDKAREVPMVEGLVRELSLFLQDADSRFGQGTALPPDAPLLLTEGGRPLYPVFADRAVKAELGAVDGLRGRKSPHVLRHSLATALLEGGATLEGIKELLGHANLAATQVYTHNSVERLKRQYLEAHPRASAKEKL